MALKGAHTRRKCEMCGQVVSSSNMRRHKLGKKCEKHRKTPRIECCGSFFLPGEDYINHRFSSHGGMY